MPVLFRHFFLGWMVMLLPPPTQVVPGTFDPAPGTVATLTEKSCFSGWGVRLPISFDKAAFFALWIASCSCTYIYIYSIKHIIHISYIYII